LGNSDALAVAAEIDKDLSILKSLSLLPLLPPPPPSIYCCFHQTKGDESPHLHQDEGSGGINEGLCQRSSDQVGRQKKRFCSVSGAGQNQDC